MVRTYSELIRLATFEDRFNYLKLHGVPGAITFGSRRWLNQVFYKSKEWLKFRREIIIRDQGCDLGVVGFEIYDAIYIHHLNPITEDDILTRAYKLLDPDNAICVRFSTHNAIHYGDEDQLLKLPDERRPFDTCPWKK